MSITDIRSIDCLPVLVPQHHQQHHQQQQQHCYCLCTQAHTFIADRRFLIHWPLDWLMPPPPPPPPPAALLSASKVQIKRSLSFDEKEKKDVLHFSLQGHHHHHHHHNLQHNRFIIVQPMTADDHQKTWTKEVLDSLLMISLASWPASDGAAFSSHTNTHKQCLSSTVWKESPRHADLNFLVASILMTLCFPVMKKKNEKCSESLRHSIGGASSALSGEHCVINRLQRL